MRRETRFEALRATAKLALSISIAGCGSSSTAPPEAPVDPAHASVPPKPITAPSPSASATPPAPSASYYASAEGRATCVSVLDDAFGPGGKKNTPDAQACCREMLKRFDETKHYGECCNTFMGTDREIRIGCSPWGPPVPPRMLARSLRATSPAAGATSGSSTGIPAEA
jgi:hypothetical protein